MEYEFNLKFKLAADEAGEDFVMNRLGEAGCTDAFVGLGMPGYVSLNFIRDAASAEEAILSALSQVKRALPHAQLAEAGPDFVGLTDVADLVGVTRQNMRKMYVNNSADFPAPVHGGSKSIWHLAQVLLYLGERQYQFSQSVLDVSRAAMQVNLARDKSLKDARFVEELSFRLAA